MLHNPDSCSKCALEYCILGIVIDLCGHKAARKAFFGSHLLVEKVVLLWHWAIVDDERHACSDYLGLDSIDIESFKLILGA